LTEAAWIALDYANSIFQTGDELFSAMHARSAGERQLLRIGALSKLSRNFFQLELVRSWVYSAGLYVKYSEYY